jgi:hypothetical protein
MTFELRTYTAMPGRMDALLRRFRDHTDGLFATHGMVSVGYWVPVDDAAKLVYVLRHDGDPEENWAAFRADPRWIEVAAESTADGELVADIQSTWLEPTDFSAIV